ncbi:uncharacterized protein V6R79_018120 [Siganus canaliculatus]
MASKTRSEEQYYEKIKSIQQTMHKREKRRLELERELFAYSRSDKRISQIKCSKLRSYLKEICDREARAKMRNLELLRDVERIEIGMKEYSPDHGPLHQQKNDFLQKTSRLMDARKQELGDSKEEAALRQNQERSLFQPPKDFTQPAVATFRGRQPNRESDAETGTTSVYSQAMDHSPNRSVQSHEHIPSGLLKDFKVAGEDATSSRARLSDDISGSNDSPDVCNLSDKHERMMAALPSVRALIDPAGNVPAGSEDEQDPSPLVTLTGLEKKMSPSSISPLMAENSPAQHTDSRGVSHQLPVMEDGEKGLSHLMPETTFGAEAEDAAGRCESVSTPSSDVQLSESTASDLSISLTQSEPEEDLADNVTRERSVISRASEDQSQRGPESSCHSDGSEDTPQLKSESSAPAVISESLSQEGFFNLLDNIEGRLNCESTRVYEVSSADAGQLGRIISFCNRGASVNDEGLEACGAVILRELPKLSWSTTKGCLLPRDVVNASQSCTEPRQISASLPPDAAQLWDRWFKHALVLKEQRVLSTELLVQLFTPLLVERHATYSQQVALEAHTLCHA